MHTLYLRNAPGERRKESTSTIILKNIFISFRSFVYCIRMYICRRFIGMHTLYLRNAPGERRKDGLHILVSHRTDWYHTESAAGAWNHPVHRPEIQTAALVSR